jgi:hypothetical protein
MWAVKVLNGPQAGKIYQLDVGGHTLGRGAQASIKIKSASVSKVHAKIVVTEDKVILSDNNSSNGIVVNGVRIQNKVLRSGDKFSLGDVLFDVIKLPNYVTILPDAPTYQQPTSQGNNALVPQELSMISTHPETGLVMGLESNKQLDEVKPQLSLQQKVEDYIENVALPGVYEYSYKFDLKYVVLSFVIFFIILVTALSVFPVLKVSHDFVIAESGRRADTLAKLLVQENREYIVNKKEISVNVRAVLNEPGVDLALIVDAVDGRIIAPTNQRGRYAKTPFVQRARKHPSRYKEIIGNQVGVSRPILYNNPKTGEPSAVAYAIVMYSLDRAALDVPRTLSLMIQILLITMIAGSVLYFFLYKVITKPVYDLNEAMNTALKEGNNSIELETPTPIFQQLISNINSALSRMNQDDSQGIQVGVGDKSMEASELVEMFPVAAIAITPENEMIIAHNNLISGHPLFDDGYIKDKLLEDLTDSSLIDSIKDLLQKAVDNPNQKHVNNLPSGSGINFEIAIKSIQEMGSISYYIICFTEIYEDEEDSG